MRYLVRLITPPSGLCIDPFCGSGTTGIACDIEGFGFIGIDNSAESCEIATNRIKGYAIELEGKALSDFLEAKKKEIEQWEAPADKSKDIQGALF